MHDALAGLATGPLQIQPALLAAAAGLLLGFGFFWGLWWTTRHAIASPRPAVVVFASLLLRMSLTLGGIYLVADGHWERVLACLLGFMLARVATVRLMRPTAEAQHAP